MGTRSVTTVMEGETPLVSLYGQFDGYPDGVGLDIAEFLLGAVVGNGIRGGESRNFFNGMGDLAARLVSMLKGGPQEIGGHYIVKPGDLQEFNYTIKGPDAPTSFDSPEGSVTISVTDWSGNYLFDGSPEDFVLWAQAQKDEDY